MKTAFATALLATTLLFVACSTGRQSTNRPPAGSATRAPAGFSLPRLPTGTPAPAGEGAPQAAGVARAALAAFPHGAPSSLQLLIPQLFSNASALDLLRLSIDVGAPAAMVPARLAGLGWTWLAVADGIEGGDRYQQWRVIVLGFAETSGATQYLARPFLLPPALAAGSAGDVPAELPGDARLLRATDTVVPLTNPAVGLAGERAALLWQRGRLIFQVMQIAALQPVDLTLLTELARAVDQHHDAIMGGGAP